MCLFGSNLVVGEELMEDQIVETLPGSNAGRPLAGENETVRSFIGENPIDRVRLVAVQFRYDGDVLAPLSK